MPLVTDETDGRIAALERRLDALDQSAAVVDVLYHYAHALDFGDEEEFADCFTEDAVWEARNAATDSIMTNTGRDELRRFAEGHTRPPELYHKHFMVQPTVHIDGDTATASCYFMLLVGAPGGMPELMTFGRYVDELRMEPDGRWRIAVRRAEADAWNPMWGALRNIRRRGRARREP
jgi:ketosteroid isomerase-like protein